MNQLITVRNIVIALLAILVTSVALSGFYTVNDRESGVILRNGKQIGIAGPGLSFKIPFVDSVVIVSTQNQSLKFSKLTAYSNDQQTAVLQVSVSYHVPGTEAGTLYSKY